MIIEVENTKKLNAVIFSIAIISAGITGICEMIWNPKIIILWPILFCIGLIGSTKLNYADRIKVDFDEAGIVLTRKNKSVFLLYQDIIEVQRITNYGKLGNNDGRHRMKILTKRKRYTFYTNSKEQENNTPFEITDLGGFYYELKGHGVKCN